MQIKITDLEPVDIVLEDILKTNPLYSLKVQYDDREGWCLSLIDNSWPNYVSITSGKTFLSAAQTMRQDIMKHATLDEDLARHIKARDKALKLSCDEMCSMLLAIRENLRLHMQTLFPHMQEHNVWREFSWLMECDHIIVNNEQGKQELQTLLGDCTITNALPKRFHRREMALGVIGMARLWLLGHDNDKPYLLFLTKDAHDPYFLAAVEACAIWIERHGSKTAQHNGQERA